MYIKLVRIQGFRSYRDQMEIEPFSPKNNVIVGRNGSGKSNFFSAIQFVLSDEYSHMRADERQGLIHEGTGPRVLHSQVEIVFENSDQRLPVEKEEVVLKRVIGAKKDQYFLDGKQVQKQDVQNLLESAGFSRCNPYYIVKQGKINELATAKDPQRLKLLREVAGTRVYDERKEESKEILKETELKREKIESLLKYIEDRLQTLENEKEELHAYQKWDRMKRSLEYTIYDTELQDSRKKLDSLAKKREEQNTLANNLQTTAMKANDEVTELKKRIRDLDRQFASLKEKRDQLSAEQTLKFQTKTQMELDIRDLKGDVDDERRRRDKDEEELTEVKKKIAQKQETLKEIDPQFDDLYGKEQQIKTQLTILGQRRQTLYEKEGTKSTYGSEKERDDHLKKEVNRMNKMIAEVNSHISTLKAELAEDEVSVDGQSESSVQSTQAIQDFRHTVEEAQTKISELKKQRDTIHENRQRLWSREHEITQKMSQLRDDLRLQTNNLKALSGKSIMSGIESVKKILNWMTERGGSWAAIADGYHGTLIENMNCDKKFFTAVEVTAGNKLFYHIVETDKVGAKILEEINRQKLPGEITFFPLNRLLEGSISYPDSTEQALPLQEQIDYEQKYEKVMKQVFGKVLLCRNVEYATQLARSVQMDCVTPDGDQVSHKGALTGGYYDHRRSRLDSQRKIKELNQEINDLETELRSVREELTGAETDIQRIVNELHKAEQDYSRVRESYTRKCQEKQRMDNLRREFRERKDEKTRKIQEFQNRLQTFEAQRESYKKQIGTKLLSQLTDEDKNELAQINEKEKSLLVEGEELTKKRRDVQTQKNRLENELQTKLMPKKSELTRKLQEITVEDRRLNLEAAHKELFSVNKKISALSKELGEVSDELDGYETEKSKNQQALDDATKEESDATEQFEECTKKMEKLAQQTTSVMQKKDEAVKKIRELGSLPADAFDKYQNLTYKQLMKKLGHCNEELKRYENVNKKALDQFVSFSEQKEKLMKRKEEMDTAHKSILDLMTVLEQRKYDAIQLTFRQVSRYFKEVFGKLVPQGHAELIMRSVEARAAAASSSQESGENVTEETMEERGDGDANQIEQFTGIGIKVSFVGSEENSAEMRELNQLSGGQKSLVALALIFAIQKCDPAPFYLFDEIDAALDAQHRKAVSDMMKEQSSQAQFITTTFRPELLESADKFYGVRFRNKVSHIDTVSHEEAKDFVEDDTVNG